MDKQLYKIIAGYNSGKYAQQFLEDYYDTYQEAKNRLSHPWPYDWMRYDVIEDNEENRAKVAQTKKSMKEDLEELMMAHPHLFQTPSEDPYNEFKVDGVGQGSLRGH